MADPNERKDEHRFDQQQHLTVSVEVWKMPSILTIFLLDCDTESCPSCGVICSKSNSKHWCDCDVDSWACRFHSSKAEENIMSSWIRAGNIHHFHKSSQCEVFVLWILSHRCDMQMPAVEVWSQVFTGEFFWSRNQVSSYWYGSLYEVNCKSHEKHCF